MKAIALNEVAVAELKITLTTRTAMAGLERLQRFVGDKRLVHRASFHPMNPSLMDEVGCDERRGWSSS